jgi:carbamoyl-phosphate synthase small subunit
LRLKAAIRLNDGQIFEGSVACEKAGELTGNIVFNTSMTGFTEIITDPASQDQILVFTYPMIGNSGVSFEDFQSDTPKIAALIVSELSEIESNFRSEDSLRAVLERNDIPLITGVDTRSLVRLLRSGNGLTQASILLNGGGQTIFPPDGAHSKSIRRSVKADKPSATAAVLDTGLRRDLERALVSGGISLEIFPCGAGIDGDFDCYLLPGGPGDPSGYDLTPVRDILKTGKPIFAAGLGHQLLALANGAKTLLLSPGHRGSNIPVYCKKTGKSVITLQNHGYTVDRDSVSEETVSHFNVNDGTVEGLRWREDVISVQFQPDCGIIREFIDIVKR